jgi:hypothetical protein
MSDTSCHLCGQGFAICCVSPACKFSGQPLVRGQLEAFLETFAKELRDLIAFSHPDRWPDNHPLAHEICARLTALRAKMAV